MAWSAGPGGGQWPSPEVPAAPLVPEANRGKLFVARVVKRVMILIVETERFKVPPVCRSYAASWTPSEPVWTTMTSARSLSSSAYVASAAPTRQPI